MTLNGIVIAGFTAFFIIPFGNFVYLMGRFVHIFWALLLSFAAHAQTTTLAESIDCGYRVQLTAIGTALTGQIVPNNGAATPLLSVQWKDMASNQVLSDMPVIQAELTDFGEYIFAVEYITSTPDGQLGCKATEWVWLPVLAPACHEGQEAGTYLPLDSAYLNIIAPVCGCDGTDYINEAVAMNNGITTWWAGACSTQVQLSPCGTTDMEIDVIDGSFEDGFMVQVNNLISGDFTHIQLDFGDGSPVQEGNQWASVTHQYAQGGNYRITLSAWRDDTDCVSTLSKIVHTDAYSAGNLPAPAITDYVLPGDANGDRKADMKDLMRMGLSFGQTGVPRPHAQNEWTEQYCPNWANGTLDNVNIKHSDGDGDGAIGYEDIFPMLENYSALDSALAPVVEGAPEIWFEFDTDTLELAYGMSGTLEIGADLMMGSAQNPVQNLHGLSLAVKYPEYIGHDPQLLYDACAFGPVSDVLAIAYDNRESSQYDMGFTHTNGNMNNGGSGRISRVNFKSDFIIIIDIIDRAENNIIPLTFPLRDVYGINEQGVTVPLSAPVRDTLWIKLPESTINTGADHQLADQVSVFPNPAADQATVYIGSLQPESIKLVNSLGQEARRWTLSDIAGPQRQLDLQGLKNGTYYLVITTDRGVVEKRLQIQR